MPPPPTSFRRRHFVLSKADRATWSKLLVAAFPDIRFFDDLSRKSLRAEKPPHIPLRRSLTECKGYQIEFLFDPDWVPQWEWFERHRIWIYDTPPYPNGYMYPHGDIVSGPVKHRGKTYPAPEWMSAGEVNFRCETGNKTHLSMAGKFMRLLAKVATNKSQFVLYPSMEVKFREEKGGMLWIGHDAARWCREDPQRFLAFEWAHGQGYRPLD